MVEAHELGEKLAEDAHRHRSETVQAHDSVSDGFRRRTAVYVGIIGMLLAITSVAGEYEMKETINANILASDTYGFYQARNIRQTSYQTAAESLEALLAARSDLPDAARQAIADRIKEYQGTIARYESEPTTGNGKKELLGKAQTYEAERDRAQSRDISFDFARALYEIAVVLGSVSIVAASRPLLGLCTALAIGATLLSLNGFFLLFNLSLH